MDKDIKFAWGLLIICFIMLIALCVTIYEAVKPDKDNVIIQKGKEVQ